MAEGVLPEPLATRLRSLVAAYEEGVPDDDEFDGKVLAAVDQHWVEWRLVEAWLEWSVIPAEGEEGGLILARAPRAVTPAATHNWGTLTGNAKSPWRKEGHTLVEGSVEG